MDDAISDNRLEYVEYDIKKKPNKQFGLLILKFKDQHGKVFTWCPKWDDVRFIFSLAAHTEFFNEDVYKWEEWRQFVEVAEQLPETFKHMAAESVSRDKQRLIQLIESGNLRQARVLLDTDLLKVVEWLQERASKSP